MRKKRRDVSLETIRRCLSYEPKTGIFRWLSSRRGRPGVGKRAGCIRPDGYLIITIDKTHYRAHRIAWFLMTGRWPLVHIDHINMKPSDNRWRNLRECTVSQNHGNMRAHRDSSTGIKGAYRCSKSQTRWFSRIYINGRTRYLGRFDSAKAAHAAYVVAARKEFGEFARAK